MLSQLDMMLIRQKLPVYNNLYWKIESSQPWYTVISLEKGSAIVLSGDDYVCKLSLELVESSLVSRKLLVSEIETVRKYEAVLLIPAIICGCLLYLQEHHIYNVSEIVLYTKQKYRHSGALYERGDDVVFNTTALEMECMRYYSQMLQSLHKKDVRLTKRNIANVSDDLLRILGMTVFKDDDAESLRSNVVRRLGNSVIDVVYTNNNIRPSNIFLVTETPDACIIHEHYGDTKYLCPILIDSMVDNDCLGRRFYINDTTGWCGDCKDIQSYINLVKYINSINLTSNAYRKLGEAVCNI